MIRTLSIQTRIGSIRKEKNATRRQAKMLTSKDVDGSVSGESQPKYPSDGWSTDLTKMPFFTRAEVNQHISKSGKNIGSKTHSVPTSVRKVTTFLEDEYLKEILAASDGSYFYFKSLCHHSFRKNDPPHNLKVALCIVSRKVKHVYCTCVAGAVGFCNHVLALMMKVCKFTLYECKSVSDLDNEDDMQPQQACTSMLQQWHRKGRGDTIVSQPAMEVVVLKTHQDLDRSSSRESGVRCLLYEARTLQSIKSQRADEQKLCERLKKENPKMAVAQIMEPSPESSQMLETKFGKAVQGPMPVISCPLHRIISKYTATFLMYLGLTQATHTMSQLILIQDSHSIQQQRSLLYLMNWQQLRKPYWKSLVLMKRKSMTLRPKQGGV